MVKCWGLTALLYAAVISYVTGAFKGQIKDMPVTGQQPAVPKNWNIWPVASRPAGRLHEAWLRTITTAWSSFGTLILWLHATNADKRYLLRAPTDQADRPGGTAGIAECSEPRTAQTSLRNDGLRLAFGQA
uniref:Uncharacterized protein n=1 Tax=Anopheles coluzzii TaxID=1518534 RepID=A0A8W7P9S6_ANOCL